MHLRLPLVLLALLTLPALPAPPGIVTTDPAVNDEEVDPARTEIRITFDQPMSRGGHSVVGGGPNFPKLLRTRWTDEKTFVISVQLEPEHDYALSVNSHTFTGFRNRAGQPALPHPILFRTARAGASPKPWAPPSL